MISVNMSAIFFCISLFLANGTPNWILVSKIFLVVGDLEGRNKGNKDTTINVKSDLYVFLKKSPV